MGGLVEVTCGDSVEGIEEAGYAVKEAAGTRMEGHVIEGCKSEDYARIS